MRLSIRTNYIVKKWNPGQNASYGKRSILPGDFLLYRKLLSCKVKKCSARMRTAAYKVDVASDRRKRDNVPRHILFL